MSTRPPAVTSCPPRRAVPAWKTQTSSSAAALLHALDHAPRAGRRGVAGRGQDHGHARLGAHGERGALELACGGGHERLPQVAGHPRHEGLGLRVPEAHVELEHLRSVRREHQARVQAPAEVDAAAGELPQDRAVDEAGGLLRGLVVEGGNRRRGAHATGVGPRVPVTDALAVLRRRQGPAGCAVAQREQRHLLALEPLLDEDQPPGLPEGPAEDIADGGVGLGPRVADEHALPGREAVRLDHRAVAEEVERVARRRLVRAGEGTRGGHAGRPHDLLGEGLRPLKRAASRPGPNTLYPEARSTSATPATSGASGPMTTMLGSSTRVRSSRPSASSTATGWHVASAEIPGLPGAQCSSSTCALPTSPTARACARPSEPTRRAVLGRRASLG